MIICVQSPKPLAIASLHIKGCSSSKTAKIITETVLMVYINFFIFITYELFYLFTHSIITGEMGLWQND